MKKIYLLIATCTAILLASCDTEPVKKEIALQTYSLKPIMREVNGDADKMQNVLYKVAEMGYTHLETCGGTKIYGIDYKTFKKLADNAGLIIRSGHHGKKLSPEQLASGDFSEKLKEWDEVFEAYKYMGAQYLFAPSIPIPETLRDLDVYCQYLNAVGRKAKEYGIQYGFHNHYREFEKIEDKEVMLDYMLTHTNPECICFEMDVYWTVIGNASPVEYFKKYPGRFKILHIKDYAEIGQSGMVGYDAIFKNLEVAGVKGIVVEQEKFINNDRFEGIRQSIEYLKNAYFVPATY